MSGALTQICGGSQSDVLNFDENYRNLQQKTSGTRLDVIDFNSLIAASNCGSKSLLDSPSVTDGASSVFLTLEDNESVRSSGIALSMPIFYANRGSNKISYSYIPALLQNSQWKIVETIVNPDGSITYLNRHGIKIVMGQTGIIGNFDFVALILNFVAALGLLTVATIVIDAAMIYFMPK